MRVTALALLLSTLCLPPSTLFAQRLSLTPAAVTVVEGKSEDIMVVLSSEPTGDVIVTIVTRNGADIRLDRSELTFTPSNWNQPQTVTIMADQDADLSDNNRALILIASGGGYVGSGVTVSPETAMIQSPSETFQLKAVIQDQDDAPVTDVALEWSSADSSIAVVDSTGKVTAVSAGTTTVTAAFATAEGTATISVGDASLSERDILEILFKATGGEEWNNRDGWLTDAPLEDWHGVHTDTESRVTELRLDDNNLRGPIPPELGSLTNLESLSLWNNKLSGPIPPELGSLNNLRRLSLGSNELSGSIPPEFGSLTNLQQLSLERNKLSGLIPPELGSLNNLQSLHVRYNKLSGPIPPELGSLNNLQWLHFGQNELSGPIPPELGSLNNLQSLYLRNNVFSGPIPPELGSLTNLTSLFLSNNKLSGPIPPELGSLANLQELVLNINELSGPIPPELGSLTNLQWKLILSNNKLSGPIPPELGSLAILEVLELKDNELSGTIPPSFQQLLELESFNFENNSGLCLPEVLVVWYEALNDRNGPVCPDREVLRVLYETAGGDDWTNATGWLTDDPLSDWFGVEVDLSGRVSIVDLAGNGLSGRLTIRLGDLAALTALRIGNNALTGPLPTSLRLLPLQELHYANTGLCAPVYDASFQAWLTGVLSHQGTGEECSPPMDRKILEVVYNVMNGPNWNNSDNWLTDAPLEQWHGVKTSAGGRVVSLDLQRNGLSGPIPPELGGLTELESLILFRNRLTGPIPSELGNLANAKLIVLAVNQLSGPIPPELGGLASLQELFLNRNQLTSVPPELGRLVSLETLALDYNQLTSVPPELGGLGQLEDLGLLSNQLTSVPPELGQLVNLRILDLEKNQLTSIPPELGRLENLNRLFLSFNELTSFPEELSALNALYWLSLEGNRLTSTPDLSDGFPFLRLLDLSSNGLTSFPWELAELSSLQILELDGNRLTDFPPKPDHIGGANQIVSDSARELSFPARWSESGDSWRLDSDESRFTSVSRKLDGLRALQARMTDDADRKMAGRMRPDIFPSLEVLDLSSNELSGPLPEALLEFTGIASLGLADNVSLSGPLPLDLTALEQLVDLHTSGTGLCAPADPVFLNWLNGVTRQRVMHCEQGESSTVYLTQAVQSRGFPVPLVAGKRALLRVFLTARAGGANMPPVRATFYRDGAVIHRAEIPGTSNPIPTNIDEGSLLKSANVEIPGQMIQPGLEVVIEPDPDGTLDPSLGVVRRIPAAGRMAVDVRAMPVFEVTLVPFIWQESPDYSIVDTVAAMASDPEGHELFERTHLLLPISEINATAHEPVVTSTNNAHNLLAEVETIRNVEGGRGHYLAVMAPPTTPEGLGGIAFNIGSWSSFSVLDSEVIAHEFGHNRALYHAPCGGAGGPDRFYPYEDGNIGAWGYDFDTAELVPPSQSDYMSYCDPTWTSDYQFTNAVRYRLKTETNSSLIAADIAQVASDRTLMLWGGLDDEGTPYLRPSFFIDAPPALPEADGPWSLTGTDESGAVLFSLSFAMAEFTDTDNQRAGFSFAVPVTWTEELAAITLQGPDSSASLDRDTDQPITILRDATTGRIRGILDGFQEAAALSMAAATGEDPQNIQVLFSRGIPDPADASQ